MILVVSSQSYLGKSYIKFKKNKNIVSTFHRKKIFKNSKYFYLGKTEPEKILSNKIDTCLLLITLKNKNSKTNEKTSNIEFKNFTKNLKMFINTLIRRNIHIIFFSTETVYENLKDSKHNERAKLKPINNYGKHKVEIEKYIERKTHKYSILRLGRVYSSKRYKNNILTAMVSDIINSKKKNYIFSDDYEFSPLYLEDLNNILELIIKKKIYGKYNVSGDQSLTYYKLAKKIINKLKIKNKIKIEKNSIVNFSNFTKPGSISMNNKNLKKKIKFKFTNTNDFIIKYLRTNKSVK